MEWAWASAIIIRLLAPLTILRWPLGGSLLAIMADNLDVIIWDYFGVTDFSPYNQVDKALDHYIYIIQAYTVLSWKNQLAKKTSLLLLFHRTAGLVIYEITQVRLVLFLFPNLFLAFYLLNVVARKYWKKEIITSVKSVVMALLFILPFKLGQEYFLHVAQFPFYSLLKANYLTRIFGAFGSR